MSAAGAPLGDALSLVVANPSLAGTASSAAAPAPAGGSAAAAVDAVMRRLTFAVRTTQPSSAPPGMVTPCDQVAKQCIVEVCCERLMECVPAHAAGTHWRPSLQVRLANLLLSKLDHAFLTAGPPVAPGGPGTSVVLADGDYALTGQVDSVPEN